MNLLVVATAARNGVFPQQAILSQTGRTSGPLNTSVPIVTFNQSIMNNTQPGANENCLNSFCRPAASSLTCG